MEVDGLLVQKVGDRFGIHRVLEPTGVLPQPAWRLDAKSPLFDNECLIEVERLNIDSASFTQIKQASENDKERMKQMIIEIVAERGKMHNPVTGSGGMLIGRVVELGNRFPGNVRVGDRIATLVSLTLTPLLLEEIYDVQMTTGQVSVSGKAILFESGPFAVLPEDLPEQVSLAALDVCGAPAQTKRLVQPTDTVVVLGAGGKSGLLSLAQAWNIAKEHGKVIALEANQQACEEIKQLGIAHEVGLADATKPLEVYEKVRMFTNNQLADLTINCVNVPDTELSSILCTKEGGITYYFSMAVKFTAAALGAEGVGKDVQLMIGNGYAPNHAETTLGLLREYKGLRQLFTHRYVK